MAGRGTNSASATYSFSSAPKPVAGARKKYREPGEDLTVYRDLKETCITWDRRVHRGNTYSSHTHAALQADAAGYEAAPTGTLKRGSKPRQKEQKIFDMPLPEADRIPVDLTKHLVVQDEHKVEVDHVEAQTDEFLPEPPQETYQPQKTGVDVTTQVEDGDLFVFDREVDPILEVIVSKTLEQSLMEVEEEHEMEQMKVFKEEWYKRQAKMMDEWQEQVDEEWECWRRKEEVMAAKREQKLREARVLLKIQAIHSAKQHLAKAVPDAVACLQEVAFPDMRGQAINQVFLPQLLGQVHGEVDSILRARRHVSDMLGPLVRGRQAAQAQGLEAHRAKTREKEHKAFEATQRKRGRIRIHVDVGEGRKVPVGPIQISAADAIEVTQANVYQWLQEQRPDLASNWPHGVLLCVGGEPVRSTNEIFDAGAGQITMVAKPETPVLEEGAQDEDPDGGGDGGDT